MNKVLITGVTGQTGSYLAEFYVAKGWEVHGTIRQRSNLAFLSAIENQISLHVQDIKDPHGIRSLVEELKPDVVHHLAAMTFVPYSWVNPLDTFENNVQGTINILEAVKNGSPATVVHFAGTSEEYGIIYPDEVPVSESQPLRPTSPYGIAKLAGDMLTRQYTKTFGVHTVITRAFNHESPRRGKEFISTQVVQQALAIKAGKQQYFVLGSLEPVRDFTDARDIARAYYLAVTDPHIEYGLPYNVCSGKGYSIRELVDTVKSIVGIDAAIVTDPKRVRKSDNPVLIGQSNKFRNSTQWKPEYTFEDTLKNMVEELGK